MQHSKFIDQISSSFRKKRFQKFLHTLSIKESDKILDVGGSSYFWSGSGLEQNVTILNIDLPKRRSGPYTWVAGDACNMDMFQNHHFDVVFSNSVIEHVGDYIHQRLMANEIQRVGIKYWVQTPYKHFPIEPHFLFPFYQYLPQPLRMEIARFWPLSYAKRQKRDATIDARTIWLLDYNQMRSLFPNAQIGRERIFSLTKSLLAIKV